MMKSKTILCLLLLLLLLPIAVGVQAANDGMDYELTITPKLLDQLAREIGCTVSNVSQKGSYTYKYDVACYERILRKDTPYGTYKSWDYNPGNTVSVAARPEYSSNMPYRNIIEGFMRRDLYHPDSLGQLLAEHKILYSDSPGNGLYESLLIAKKYNLRHVFFTPTAWVEQPFLNSEMKVFKKAYNREVIEYKKWLKDLESDFDVRFMNDAEQLWIVQVEVDDEPLDVFYKAVRRDFMGVKKEYKDTFGYDIPLMLNPSTPEERAHRIEFWWWLMDKYSAIARTRAEILGKHLGKHLFTGNVHFSTVLDYDEWGKIYDMPGISPRPILAEDPLVWKYIMGYSTRLLCDLTDKPIMTAPRVNMVAAGARIVPTANTIKYWYSQVVQNGGSSFFIWIRDFSGTADGNSYNGPCLANPDESTRGMERWQSILDMSKLLGNTNVFTPPKGETAILVSMDTGMLYGWKNIFSAYVELTKAGVWSNFVSDKEILTKEESLADYKVLYIPVMEFGRTAVVESILDYVKNGGTVVTGDPRIFSYTLQAEDISCYREELFGFSSSSPRPVAGEQIIVADQGQSFDFFGYGEGWDIEPLPGTQVIGKYSDGKVAAVCRKYGKGKAYFIGTGIMDIYAKAVSEGKEEDTSRYLFYKALEKESGVRDQKWIWDVNVENIQDVTGVYTKKPQAVDENIQFRLYMYPHGDRNILKYFYKE